MPRDLPGMYWDEARGRYFPVSSRPTPCGSTQTVQRRSGTRPTSTHLDTQLSHTSAHQRPVKRRRIASIGTLAEHKLSPRYMDLSMYKHRAMSSSISCLSEGKVVAYGDISFSSFNVIADANGCHVISTGDTAGWLQTHRLDPEHNNCGSSRELYLGSMVSAVCRSPTHRLAVSFGPSSKIAVESLTHSAELWTIMSLPARCFDIRTAHLSGSSLALGAARKGLLFPDIEVDWHYEMLPTESDVFSITQLRHLTYTGTRNGSITMFDRRTNTHQKGHELFNSPYTSRAKTITHLSILHEWQMLVSNISGDIALHDLRFARENEPSMKLRGHVNSYTGDIGLAVTPCNNFVFAAGQDRRIRAWSLRTGEQLSPARVQQRTYDDNFSELFHQQFTEPVSALQCIESETDGPTLWALSGRQLYRYWLGRSL